MKFHHVILSTALVAVAATTFSPAAFATDPPKKPEGQEQKVQLNGTLDPKGLLKVSGDVHLPTSSATEHVTVVSAVTLSKKDRETLAALVSAMNVSNSNVGEALAKLAALGIKDQEVLDAFSQYLQASQQQNLLSPQILKTLESFKGDIIALNATMDRRNDIAAESLKVQKEQLAATLKQNAILGSLVKWTKIGAIAAWVNAGANWAQFGAAMAGCYKGSAAASASAVALGAGTSGAIKSAVTF